MARAVGRVLDRKTGVLVGWLYQWNTGAFGFYWVGEPVEDYIVE
jgi:hypothetical protein